MHSHFWELCGLGKGAACVGPTGDSIHDTHSILVYQLYYSHNSAIQHYTDIVHGSCQVKDWLIFLGGVMLKMALLQQFHLIYFQLHISLCKIKKSLNP